MAVAWKLLAVLVVALACAATATAVCTSADGPRVLASIGSYGDYVERLLATSQLGVKSLVDALTAVSRDMKTLVHTYTSTDDSVSPDCADLTNTIMTAQSRVDTRVAKAVSILLATPVCTACKCANPVPGAYGGESVAVKNVGSAEDCADACKSDTRCNSWSFALSGPYTGRCRLMRLADPSTAERAHFSVDFVGNVLCRKVTTEGPDLGVPPDTNPSVPSKAPVLADACLSVRCKGGQRCVASKGVATCVGTCAGYCVVGYSSDRPWINKDINCYCHESCIEYGDCCPDYKEACVPPSL